MFEMPCGQSFERDDEVVLHSESCEVCTVALAADPLDPEDREAFGLMQSALERRNIGIIHLFGKQTSANTSTGEKD